MNKPRPVLAGRTLIVLLNVIVLLSSCTNHSTGHSTGHFASHSTRHSTRHSDNETEQKRTGEILLATPPKDWISIFQLKNDSTRLTDFIPPGQSKNNWSTKISFEARSTETLSLDPIELLFLEAEADQSRCNRVSHYNIFSGLENNYQTSVRLFLCGENTFTHRGEIKLIKAIRGDGYLYSVRIVRRTPPFDVNKEDITQQEVALWSTYLRKISVCDGSTEHPCPKTESESEPEPGKNPENQTETRLKTY